MRIFVLASFIIALITARPEVEAQYPEQASQAIACLSENTPHEAHR
jgi:hypothetical protein